MKMNQETLSFNLYIIFKKTSMSETFLDVGQADVTEGLEEEARE